MATPTNFVTHTPIAHLAIFSIYSKFLIYHRFIYHESLEVYLVSRGVLVHDTNCVDKSGHIYPCI